MDGILDKYFVSPEIMYGRRNTRLALLEVLCRAFTVVEGHPYHNE